MSSSPVDQIKSRLGIVDVVGSYVKLQKAGTNYKALSPFTSEKTPSFHVSPSRGLYYCFSSGKGGDIFSFVQEMEGVDFAGALKILAERAGVELKPMNPEKRTLRDALFAAMEAATRFYESELPKSSEVVEYLKNRGLTGQTAKDFRVGFVPDGWRNLHDVLVKKGFSGALLEKAGLVVESPKGYYDRFRSRIMFPIFDSSGRVVAFSGRIFETDPNAETKGAKYVNSPETDLYNKSEVLFGFDQAKDAIRKNDRCVMVEGQMDLLMSHQAGVKETVAVSGTALSSEHLLLVKRLTNNLIFAFDDDAAGVKAAGRGFELAALSHGFEVKLASLPKGEDPADLIKENPEAWEEAVANATNIIEFHLKRTDKDASREEKQATVALVLPYIGRIQNKIMQAQYIADVANYLGINEAAVWDELRKARIDQGDSFVREEKKEKDVLAIKEERLKQQLIGFTEILKEKDALTELLSRIETEFERISGVSAQGAQEGIEKEIGQIAFEAEILLSEGNEEKIVNATLIQFEIESVKKKAAQLERKRQELEKEESTKDEALALHSEIFELHKKRDALIEESKK